MGFLWSAESAIYSSVTFLPAILIAILQRYQNKLNDSKKSVSLKHLFLYATIPFFLFATVICIISTYYWLRLGQLPDFYCFVEHGLSYTGGFGQINLNTSGPVWLLFILFSTILYTIGSMILRNPLNRNLITVAAAASCLWSIGSYFIGRAVANNVTAILPLLGFISVVVLIITHPGAMNRIRQSSS